MKDNLKIILLLVTVALLTRAVFLLEWLARDVSQGWWPWF